MTERAPVASPTVAVVGGGITGLVAGRALARARGDGRVVILEAEERLGGKVRTDVLEGRISEAGPDSFVARDPEPERLCRELGLGEDLVAPAAFGAHIWTRGKLRVLPAGFVLGFPASPVGLVRARILSLGGAARALGDLLLPGPLEGPDVSIGAFVRRRFGREVLERLVDPILAGTRAGRVDTMSLTAAAPQIDAIARSHRSVLAGLMRARRRGAAGPPEFLALRGGMQRLVERLGRDMPANVEVRPGSTATHIARRTGGAYAVDASRGSALRADGVVLAVPAFAAAGLLSEICSPAARELAAIPYSSVALVSLVYPPGAGRPPPHGSGILVPSSERRVLAGCTWTSRKWPHAAPPDGALSVRCFIGRSSDDAALELDDAELAARADAELRTAMGLTAEPRARHVVRWPDALPQYEVGHNDRLGRIESALAKVPGVAVAGAGYRGSGLADCIRQGEAAARRVLAELGGTALVRR